MTPHSPDRARLLRLLGQIEFGSVEIAVAAGQLLFDPPPRIVRETLLTSSSATKTVDVDRFGDEPSVAKLFQALASIDDGTIVIECRHARPHRLIHRGVCCESG